MKELSIFVDESGDFGDFAPHSPYYLISMVFHNQSKSIEQDVKKLNSHLINMGFSPDFYIHTGPAIRREREYHDMPITVRRKLIARLFAFFRSTPTSCEVFHIEKRAAKSSMDAIGKLSKQLSDFIRDNLFELQKYDKIKIYYDHGQTEVTKILYVVFNSLLQNVAINNASPKDYKLFQAVDLACTMELIALKLQGSGLSKSETNFFGGKRRLQKNYLRVLNNKRFGTKK